ncbi:MAG: DNA-3-methyladenine glycosylase I [Almyronema sp.]
MNAHRPGLVAGADGQLRCYWCQGDAAYQAYHDQEWGRPVYSDRRLFEKICLEGFQAGLSWLTILRKRENFRQAFAQFDFAQVARYTSADVERLLQNAAIIRHRRKIESAINNAQRACELLSEYESLAAYFWQFQPPNRPAPLDYASLSQLSQTPESVALSRDLKRRGWTFVGPTTLYAFMQAVGIVNDHLEGCFVRPAVEAARAQVEPPWQAKGRSPQDS